MTQPNLKRAARLDTKAVALASLPFMGMISFLAGLRRHRSQDAHRDLWPIQLAHRRDHGHR